jgi:hypothetical protein
MEVNSFFLLAGGFQELADSGYAFQVHFHDFSDRLLRYGSGEKRKNKQVLQRLKVFVSVFHLL